MSAEETAVKMDSISPGAALSKFSLSRLALKSALELEKAKIGMEFEGEVLKGLADALSQTSPDQQEGVPFRSVRSGYHRPLVRLYRDRCTADPKSMEEVRTFVAEAISHLKDFNASADRSSEIDKLIAFCTSLHRELVYGLAAENRLVLKQRKTPRSAAARFSATTT